jgi:hypothetical protein
MADRPTHLHVGALQDFTTRMNSHLKTLESQLVVLEDLRRRPLTLMDTEAARIRARHYADVCAAYHDRLVKLIGLYVAAIHRTRVLVERYTAEDEATRARLDRIYQRLDESARDETPEPGP